MRARLTPVPQLRRTLTLSILDGVFYSVMVGVGETYFAPYALALGASNLVLGLLLAFPLLVGSVVQLFAEALITRLGSRRRVIGLAAGLQALTFVPMAALGFTDAPARAVRFLVVVCLYWAFQLTAGPAWNSLMGDLVPESARGAYFGRRSRFVQLATFLSMLLAGVALTQFRERGLTMYGFALAFAIAAVARLTSMGLLLRHHEPPMSATKKRQLWALVTDALAHPTQRHLIRYVTSMNFAVYVSAAYFAAYMLRRESNHGLAWSYTTYTVVTATAAAAKFLFLPLWGRAGDRFGSRKALTLSAWLVVALPLPWLLPTSNAPLHFAAQLFAQVWSGLAWGGHELMSFNFLLDSTPPPERARLTTAMNVVNGVMVFAGSAVGAVLVAVTPPDWNPFFVVFVASSALRLLVTLTLLPRLREVRIVEHISYGELFFRVVAVRPQLGPMLRFFSLPRRGS